MLLVGDYAASLNVILSSLLVVWPVPRSSICPATATVKNLERALEFAHQTAEECLQRSSFSLFWLGFWCGIVLITLLYALLTVLVKVVFKKREEVRQPVGLQPLAAPASLPAITHSVVVEPANPNTLRVLGLCR